MVTSRDPAGASAMATLSTAEQRATVLEGLPDDVTRGRLRFMVNDDAMASLSSSAARGALAANDVPTAQAALPECLHSFVRSNALYE